MTVRRRCAENQYLTAEIEQARDDAARSQEAVEAQRAYLETVLGRLSSGVIALDADERLRTANPAALHILKLEEHREAYLLPLEEIREKLRDHMREERMEAAVEQEIERLREQGEVEILIALERPKDK